MGDTELVLSKSDETGEVSYRKVVNTFIRQTEAIYTVSFADGTVLETTWNHPFRVKKQGHVLEKFSIETTDWVQAKDLHPGDVALGADGRELAITDITIDEREETVYNFEVEGYHTYFVGEVGVWVHNAEYIVKKGDTLWGIAKENGLNWNILAKANGLEVQDGGKVLIKPGDKIELPEQRDSLSLTDALGHYRNGNGQDLIVPFASVNSSGMRPEQFKPVKDLLSKGQPGTYKLQSSQYGTASGTDWGLYGRMKFNLSGTLTIDKSKNYNFIGSMSSGYDEYDFNPSNRGIVAETATWAGRQLNGTPYYIYFEGKKDVKSSGKIK